MDERQPDTRATGSPAPSRDGSDRSDQDLLAAHVEGDPDAFTALVHRHSDRLWAVALRTVGDRQDAADALQEAWLSAFRHAGDFRVEAAVSTWLHRIVVNACLDRLRRRAARPTSPLLLRGADGQEYDRRESIDPVDHHARAELTADLERALATLPAAQRAALVLVDVQGYPVAEAAWILEVAPGTVKSRCARGRARLASVLRPVGPDHVRDRPGGNATAAPCVELEQGGPAAAVHPAPDRRGGAQ